MLKVGRVELCRFIKRLNRFVALVETRAEPRLLEVHLSNTGRLEQYLVYGRRCVIAPIKGRKLSYRLIGVEDIIYGDRFAVIDTFLQNDFFEILVNNKKLEFFSSCYVVKRNPRIGGAVFDFLLRCNSSDVIVETKSAVFRGEKNEALYPDCPTLRGQKHVEILINLHLNKSRVALVFLAGFPGARCFKPYSEIDARISELISKAYKKGVPIYGVSFYGVLSTRSEFVIVPDSYFLPPCEEWLANL